MENKAQLILANIKKLFNVKMSEVTTEDGAIIYFDGELTEGTAVWITVDTENVPLPVGEYKLASGQTLVIEEAGIVARIDPAPDATATDATPGTASTDVSMSAEELLNAIKKELEPLKTQLSALKQENATLKIALSQKPASDGVKRNPEGKSKVAETGLFSNKANATGMARISEMLWGGN